MTDRIETDSLGDVKVPKEAMWGAQTERSRQNFKIGQDIMPLSVIYGLVEIKRGAAIVNETFGILPTEKKEAIVSACDEILRGEWDEAFPLKVYQTGSGTQTNMNCNEVIARICQLKGVDIHPNDHVNMSQSSNDTFPTAMHIAAYKELTTRLIPELDEWIRVLAQLEKDNATVIKIGRTHLQDATPLTFGQEISGWKTMIEKGRHFLVSNMKEIAYLTIGGTAVGTGLNAPKGFDRVITQEIREHTGCPFESEPNKFYGLTSHSELGMVHGIIRSLAGDVMKIANDIRWLASGPRAGLGEINIPENEPGSSIMPGKVNPTQAEALTMVVCQVMGNDTTIQVASSQGNFELNVYKPVIINNFLESVQLMTEGMTSFRIHCLEGIVPNMPEMERKMTQSLMLVTALSPHIGYEQSAKAAKYAHAHELELKEAVLQLGLATEMEYNEWVVPEEMV